MPEELREQVPLIKEMLSAMGINIMSLEGYEADDLLGTVARRSEAKGMDVAESFDTSIDIDIDAYIPMGYIPNEMQKLDIYKRIAGIETADESEEMLEELIDRFGDPPKSVENLLYIARVKSMAHHLYFTDIAQKGDTLRFTLYENAKINVAAIPEFTASFDKHVKFTMDAKEPYFTYFLKLNTREKYVEAKDVMETFLQRAGEMLMEK